VGARRVLRQSGAHGAVVGKVGSESRVMIPFHNGLFWIACILKIQGKELLMA
jgi:hypothetical protein